MDLFKQWMKKPFDTDMDLVHWFLFAGLLIFIMALWRFILAHMKGAIA